MWKYKTLLLGALFLLPDPQLTPGVRTFDMTAAICAPGYSKTHRHVTTETKREVFHLYGISWARHKAYEVDHFIPLELGGSNNIHNLWPQPYEPKPGAREKDVIENALHQRVCKGEMTLDVAVKQIKDWVKEYEDNLKNKR